MADSRIPAVSEGEMIAAYGEGKDAGITPLTKIPVIATDFRLDYNIFDGKELGQYLRRYLAHSYVFCAYQDGATSHAVLIYRLSGQDLTHVSCMDPRGGYHCWHPLSWFETGMVVMRK